MGSFFTPGDLPIPADPLLEVPTPDIPVADFVSIGAAKRKGEKDSGFWDWFLQLILDWIPAAVGKVVGALMGLVLMVAANFIRLFFDIFHNSKFGMDTLAAELVGGLFDVNVSSSAFAQYNNHDARKPEAANIAEAILVGLAGDFKHVGAGGITPNSDGAEKYLTTILEMEMAGWSQDLLFELVSAGQIQSAEHLRHAMEAGLGLGRLSRRVLGVPLGTLVVTPFQQLINERFRPTLLPIGTLVKQFHRGTVTRAQLDTELGRHGYSPERIEALITQDRHHLPPGMLVKLNELRLIDDPTFYQQMGDAGIDRESADLEFNATIAEQRNGFKMALARYALERFRHGDISGVQLDVYITDNELTFSQQTFLRSLANFEVSSTKTKVSLSQGVQMVERGIWTITRFRDLLVQHGYALADTDDLELLLLSKIETEAEVIAARDAKAHAKALADQAKAAAIARKAAAALVEERVHGVSIARYETLVLDGVKSIGEYAGFLTDKGLASDNVQAFTAHLQIRLDRAAALAAARGGAGAAARQKALSVSQLEKAVKDGALTMGEYSDRLTRAGVSAADAAILVDVLTADMEKAAVRAAAIADAHARSLHHGLNLHEEQLAVRQGFRSVADYQVFLAAAGYADPDAGILVDQMMAQIAADERARALRAAHNTAAGPRGLNLAQSERAVRAGVLPIGNYTAELARAGYDADSQTALTSLLQMRIAQDARTAELRGQAAGALAARGLTLSDVERAVKAKVLPMSAYTDALARAGVSADAANVLSLTLAAGIKTVTPSAVVVKTVSALLTAAGFSLSHLESDVVAGRLTLPAFSGILSAAGVAGADIARISAVLQLELDQKAAAAALLEQAKARAAARQLSLAQELAAVKVGVQGLPDYTALAAKLGYDPAAVQILAATLAAQLAPAAPAPGV